MTKYKIISGTIKKLEKELNELAKDEWVLVCSSVLGMKLVLILSKREWPPGTIRARTLPVYRPIPK